MQDTPAPEGDIQSVEKGLESLSQPPGERREPLAGPRPPEAGRPRETGAPPQQTTTPAEAEAKSAGGQAARALVGTGPQPEIPGPPSSEPPSPTTRGVQPFMKSALRATALRQRGLKSAEEAA